MTVQASNRTRLETAESSITPAGKAILMRGGHFVGTMVHVYPITLARLISSAASQLMVALKEFGRSAINGMGNSVLSV